MIPDFATEVLGTVVLWTLSGVIAVTVAMVLAAASLGRQRPFRLLSNGVITLTRGVPTSLLVVGAGIAAMPHTPPAWLPNAFPGTSQGLTLVAWAVTVALAVGSTGHLAVIFRTGYLSLGASRLEQATVLGLRPARRLGLLLVESAGATSAPLGARLVHHLHNTAFAALFPVADFFGWIQQRANETFEVSRYAAVGVGVYVVLSLLIWAMFRALEHWLGIPARRSPAALAEVPT